MNRLETPYRILWFHFAQIFSRRTNSHLILLYTLCQSTWKLKPSYLGFVKGTIYSLRQRATHRQESHLARPNCTLSYWARQNDYLRPMSFIDLIGNLSLHLMQLGDNQRARLQHREKWATFWAFNPRSPTQLTEYWISSHSLGSKQLAQGLSSMLSSWYPSVTQRWSVSVQSVRLEWRHRVS